MKKRLLSMILALSMMLTILPINSITALAEEPPVGGSCKTSSSTGGDDAVKWSFDKTTGTLTISGQGNMPNYVSRYGTPWRIYYQPSDIKKIAIEEGVTSIGAYSFYGLENLEETEIVFPEGLKKIGSYAFWENTSLTKIVIPSGMDTIQEYAFRSCTSLKDVTIKSGVEQIWHDSFLGCTNLEKIYYTGSLYNLKNVYWNDRTVADNGEATITYTNQNPIKVLYICTVKLNPGSGTLADNKVQVYYSEKVTDTKANDLTAVPVPTRSGYEFTGWYTDQTTQDATTKFDADNTPITGDTTLYAGWAKIVDVTVPAGVTVAVEGENPVTADGSAIKIAQGKKVTLTAGNYDPNYEYDWTCTGSTGKKSPDDHGKTFEFTVGTDNVNVTLASALRKQKFTVPDDVTVTVNGTEVQPDANKQVEVELTKNVTLTLNDNAYDSNYAYSWTGATGTASPSDHGKSFEFTVSEAVTEIGHTSALRKQKFTVSDDVTVTVDGNEIQPGTDGKYEVELTKEVTLTVKDSAYDSNCNYTWSGANGTESGEHNKTFTFTVNDQITEVGYAKNLRKQKFTVPDDVTVTVDGTEVQPDANKQVEVELTKNVTLTLNDNAYDSNYAYSWTGATGTASPSDHGKSFEFTVSEAVTEIGHTSALRKQKFTVPDDVTVTVNGNVIQPGTDGKYEVELTKEVALTVKDSAYDSNCNYTWSGANGTESGEHNKTFTFTVNDQITEVDYAKNLRKQKFMVPDDVTVTVNGSVIQPGTDGKYEVELTKDVTLTLNDNAYDSNYAYSWTGANGTESANDHGKSFEFTVSEAVTEIGHTSALRKQKFTVPDDVTVTVDGTEVQPGTDGKYEVELTKNVTLTVKDPKYGDAYKWFVNSVENTTDVTNDGKTLTLTVDDQLNTIDLATTKYTYTVGDFDVSDVNDCTYDGKEHPATVTPKADHGIAQGDYTVEYKKDGETDSKPDAPKDAGTYTVIIKKGNTKIEGPSFTIEPKAPGKDDFTVTLPDGVKEDAETSQKQATAEVKNDSLLNENGVTIDYSYRKVNEDGSKTAVDTPTDAGKYEYVATIKSTNPNVSSGEVSWPFTIGKKAEQPGGDSGNKPGDGGNTDPTPKPEEKPDRKMKIDGGIVEVNGKEVKPDEDGNIIVKEGDEITITFDKSTLSDAQVFDQWTIKPDSVLNEIDPKSEKISFKMPAETVTVEAMTRDATIEDDGPGILGTGAMIATVGISAAALAYQGHMLGTEFALRCMLPEWALIPQNRAELAVLLWQDADSPEPVSTNLYSDISEDDSAVQKAARWAVENDLMELLDAEEAPENFDPFVPVTYLDSIHAWKKAQELKK